MLMRFRGITMAQKVHQRQLAQLALLISFQTSTTIFAASWLTPDIPGVQS